MGVFPPAPSLVPITRRVTHPGGVSLCFESGRGSGWFGDRGLVVGAGSSCDRCDPGMLIKTEARGKSSNMPSTSRATVLKPREEVAQCGPVLRERLVEQLLPPVEVEGAGVMGCVPISGQRVSPDRAATPPGPLMAGQQSHTRPSDQTPGPSWALTR